MPASPSLRRRRLAAQLRKLRDESSLSRAEVAERLRWDHTKIFRVETRQSGISAPDLRKLLDVYGVEDREYRSYLVDLARRVNERGWWQQYSGLIGTEYADLIGLEDEARAIRSYQQELVPGLLQTPDYARAVIRASRPNDTTEEIDRRVEVRMERQEVLARMDPPPPRINVVLSEAVLRRSVGGRDVMRLQVDHLMRPRDRANVTVQVLPFSAGEHPSMVASFTVMTFPDPDDLGIAFVENPTGAVYLETPEELRVYDELWNKLQANAFSEHDTQTFLKSTSFGYRVKEGM